MSAIETLKRKLDAQTYVNYTSLDGDQLKVVFENYYDHTADIREIKAGIDGEFTQVEPSGKTTNDGMPIIYYATK